MAQNLVIDGVADHNLPPFVLNILGVSVHKNTFFKHLINTKFGI